MARPKSIIQRVEVDAAQKAHNCQHNQNHRLQRGDKRLKVWKDRSPEHFCVKCGLEMIGRDIAKLTDLAAELEATSTQPRADAAGENGRAKC